MELSQIRYFVALCDELSFTRAARRCRVSQPSLSNGIKALEFELGGQLFERTSVVLTPLGKRVRPHLENAITSIKAAGVYKGSPASIDAAKVRELKGQGIGPAAIAKQLGIGRASVYRALASQVSD